MAPIEEKLTQHRLRWFGHVKRGKGRPKLTWDESVKRDLKDWNISKEIVWIGALGD